MDEARGRRRHVPTRAALVTAVLLAGCPSALALNPALDISQYAHTAWLVRDGFSKGFITCFAQTADGYLWLGSEFGLLRFDGVRAIPWRPPAGQSLADVRIRSLLAARDGTLWIGTIDKGVVSWKDGKLTQYPPLAGNGINALVEDRDGTVWIGAQDSQKGRLCGSRAGQLRCYGTDGDLGPVYSLYEEPGGTLWVGTTTGLWQWKSDSTLHRISGVAVNLAGLAKGDDGELLIGTIAGGIRRLADGSEEVFHLPGLTRQFDGLAFKLLRDRDGGLWVGTSRGLLHVHRGRTDVLPQSDGLSGDIVNRLFEDREGNIWVATTNGLDRFREYAVSAISVKQGLSGAVASVQTARDDSLWIGTTDGLRRWKDGRITTSVGRRAQGVRSLFQSASGRIWAATLTGVSYLDNDQLIPIEGVLGRSVTSMVEDTTGNLWIADYEHGLLRVSTPHHNVQPISWARLGRDASALYLAADHVHGGLWLGFGRGGVAYFADGQIRTSYGAADGLGEGGVSAIQADQDGTVWVATAGGLSRLKDGRVATLTTKNGLPCDTVHWSMRNTDSAWLYTACGLVRVARSEFDGWGLDPTRRIQATVFDASDGVRLHSSAVGHYSPQAAMSSDGRLWFDSGDGSLSALDPKRLPFNRLPPPVQIEKVTADRNVMKLDATDRATLPALTRDLEIDYTALSLVAPEKNHFQYKLEGYDRDWQDVGNRRQAFYTNLSPRNYRFRVIASNNSGVWNESGASLDFSIAPEYYQTLWFRLSVVAAFLSLLGALYQLRQRQIVRQFNMRLEERVNERTRIARDLHDTLLQSFHGVLLRFQSAAILLPDRPVDAQKALASGIDQAAEAIAEGRDAVQGLRSSVVAAKDLASVMSALGEELAADRTGQHSPDLSVQVEGTPRDLGPLTHDEVYRIAREALRNAYQHADATRIVVEVRYDPRQFRLRVRDDGKGMDQKIADERGRAGHYGLPGMRERAKLLRGTLTIWSELDSGTEVELTIPGSVAYARSSDARPSPFSELI